MARVRSGGIEFHIESGKLFEKTRLYTRYCRITIEKRLVALYPYDTLPNHLFNYGHSFNYCTYSFFFFFFIHTTHVLRYHYFFFFSLSKLYMYVHILDAGTKELVRLYSIQFPFIRLSRSHERFCAKKGNKMRIVNEN